MFIRQPFKPSAKKRGNLRTPTWHTPEREIFPFTKQIDTRCGKTYIIVDSELEESIPFGDKQCGVCENLAHGKDSTMRIWSSTGYSTRR